MTKYFINCYEIEFQLSAMVFSLIQEANISLLEAQKGLEFIANLLFLKGLTFQRKWH